MATNITSCRMYKIKNMKSIEVFYLHLGEWTQKIKDIANCLYFRIVFQYDEKIYNKERQLFNEEKDNDYQDSNNGNPSIDVYTFCDVLQCF